MEPDAFEIDVVGLLFTSRDKDDFLRAQPVGQGSADPTSPDAPKVGSMQMLHPYGFSGLPQDGDAKGKAQGLQITVGDDVWIIPLDDPRSTKLLPPIQKGESFQYGAKGNFFRCHANGSLSAWTTVTGNVNDQGQSIAWLIAPDRYSFQAPWGREWFDSTGWHVRAASGGKMSLGYLASPVPAPFDKMSYFDVTATTMCFSTSSLEVGVLPPGAPAIEPLSSPLVRSYELILILTALATFLHTLVAQLSTIPVVGASISAAMEAALTLVFEPILLANGLKMRSVLRASNGLPLP